jgi:uncharacterized protein (TIGR02453 family)
MQQATCSFSPALFTFLCDLREHNDREWFRANRARYDDAVLEPAIEFIDAFRERLHAISPHFVADARPVGGSLFRIHRDTRFSKDKSPYKLHTGIQFRHEVGKDVHAPGFYLHLAPDMVFAAAGLWHPESSVLGRIRERIAEDGDGWDAAKALPPDTRLSGESLKRAPAGFDPQHPRIEDLRRKDFIAVTDLTEQDVTGPGFADRLAAAFGAPSPLMRFLCAASEVPF